MYFMMDVEVRGSTHLETLPAPFKPVVEMNGTEPPPAGLKPPTSIAGEKFNAELGPFPGGVEMVFLPNNLERRRDFPDRVLMRLESSEMETTE